MQLYILDAIRKAEDFLNHMNFRSMAIKGEVLRKAPHNKKPLKVFSRQVGKNAILGQKKPRK